MPAKSAKPIVVSYASSPAAEVGKDGSAPPTKALLGLNMVQARGRWHEIDVYGGKARALATFSPTYLLRMPAAKAQAWEDLQLLLEGLGS